MEAVFYQHCLQSSHLIQACIVPEADAQGTAVQRTGAFVGKGRAVQTGAQGNPPAAQILRQFLPIPRRQEGQGAALLRTGKNATEPHAILGKPRRVAKFSVSSLLAKQASCANLPVITPISCG